MCKTFNYNNNNNNNSIQLLINPIFDCECCGLIGKCGKWGMEFYDELQLNCTSFSGLPHLMR